MAGGPESPPIEAITNWFIVQPATDPPTRYHKKKNPRPVILFFTFKHRPRLNYYGTSLRRAQETNAVTGKGLP